MSKRKLKAAVTTIKKAAVSYANDVLILTGVGFGIYATFRINATAGFYAVAVALAAVGWYLTQSPLEGE